ncbi:hypothetical protein ACVIGB_005331 [Bradyrhizobium sp. USDA 4341]
MDEIEAAVTRELEVHLIMNKYATHKTPLDPQLDGKGCVGHAHLMSTGSSGLNQRECFFALLTEQEFQTGISRTVAALRADILLVIDKRNADPRPLRYTKSADDVLAPSERFWS